MGANLIPVPYVYVGSDPELFLSRDGKIIGAEKVVPGEGLGGNVRYGDPGVVMLDGVQVELHPRQGTGRPSFILNTSTALRTLAEYLKSNAPGTTISFQEVVEVDDEEYDSLSPVSKQLGCQPSWCIYSGESKINVPERFKIRSASGHLHFGLNIGSSLFQNRLDLVPIFDAILGVPGVLLNPGPAQAKRRETYGRAGEFRRPPYGLEYRTLSNFWLRTPELAGLVYDLAMTGISILFTTVETKRKVDAQDELMGQLDIPTLIKAINNNSTELASGIWKSAVRPFLAGLQGASPVTPYLNQLDKLIEKVNENGLDTMFPDPPALWADQNRLKSSQLVNSWVNL